MIPMPHVQQVGAEYGVLGAPFFHGLKRAGFPGVIY